MLESINALRREVCRNGSDRTVRLVADHIGKIEQEINERYIELPKDADGEQASIGNTVHDNENGYDFRIDGFMLWGNTTEWWAFQDQAVQQKLKNCSIVKPPTVEDVLESALNTAAMLDRDSGYWPSAADITNIVNEIAPKLQLKEVE